MPFLHHIPRHRQSYFSARRPLDSPWCSVSLPCILSSCFWEEPTSMRSAFHAAPAQRDTTKSSQRHKPSRTTRLVATHADAPYIYGGRARSSFEHVWKSTYGNGRKLYYAISRRYVPHHQLDQEMNSGYYFLVRWQPGVGCVACRPTCFRPSHVSSWCTVMVPEICQQRSSLLTCPFGHSWILPVLLGVEFQLVVSSLLATG
jgi:hypothetical protein